MYLSEEELPNDVTALKALVLDLSRRLRNSQLNLSASRASEARAIAQATFYRARLTKATHVFRRENNTARLLNQKNLSEIESKKYTELKKKASELQETLRFKELDYIKSKNKHFVPESLIKLREKVKIIEKQVESQKILLQNFIDINKINEDLIIAVQNNDLDMINSLLYHGADISYTDNIGYQPIHYACYYGNLPALELLLHCGADPTGYFNGIIPLIIASERGFKEIILLLLSYGVNINEKGIHNCPPLLAAMKAGQLEIVFLLLHYGANINSYDLYENNILHYATRLIWWPSCKPPKHLQNHNQNLIKDKDNKDKDRKSNSTNFIQPLSNTHVEDTTLEDLERKRPQIILPNSLKNEENPLRNNENTLINEENDEIQTRSSLKKLKFFFQSSSFNSGISTEFGNGSLFTSGNQIQSDILFNDIVRYNKLNKNYELDPEKLTSKFINFLLKLGVDPYFKNKRGLTPYEFAKFEYNKECILILTKLYDIYDIKYKEFEIEKVNSRSSSPSRSHSSPPSCSNSPSPTNSHRKSIKS